jgi:hypothetical protein
VGVVLLAHAAVRNEKNTEGADYGKVAPNLHKVIAEPTMAWADAILYYTFEMVAVKDGNKVIGRGGEKPILKCSPTAAYFAGNRMGLPAEIDCSQGPKAAYEALTKAKARGRAVSP